MWLTLAACLHPAPVTAPPVAAGLATVSEGELRAILAAPGRPTVVNFWASWCGPCRTELPHLDALAARMPEVRFVLVNVDEPALDGIAARTADPLQLPSVRLEVPDETSLAAALRRSVPGWADNIPFTVVVDDAGAVVQSFQGAAPTTELEEVIRTTLARGSTR